MAAPVLNVNVDWSIMFSSELKSEIPAPVTFTPMILVSVLEEELLRERVLLFEIVAPSLAAVMVVKLMVLLLDPVRLSGPP